MPVTIEKSIRKKLEEIIGEYYTIDFSSDRTGYSIFLKVPKDRYRIAFLKNDNIIHIEPHNDKEAYVIAGLLEENNCDEFSIFFE